MSFQEWSKAKERPNKSLYNSNYFVYINILKNEFKLKEEIK